MVTCPNCGNQVGENAIFCDQCGTRLPKAEAAAPAAGGAYSPAPTAQQVSVICPACGAANVPGEAFCDTCGSPLASPVPAEPSAPAPTAGSESSPAGQPPQAEPVPPAAQDQTVCPSCGTAVLPGEVFCSNCGASLVQGPIVPEPVPDLTPPPPGPEPVLTSAPPVEAPPPEAAPEAIIVPPPAPEPEPTPAPLTKCPVCGAPAEPDDTFCSTCGAALKAAPAPTAAPPAPAEGSAPAPIAESAPPPAAGSAYPPAQPAPAAVSAAAGRPRLVIEASGAEIPLPSGNELLIGREDPVSGIFPDVDMTPHGGEEGGVSRRHARLLFDNGRYAIEDLDSTNYTFVNKQKLAPGMRQPLQDGDEIRLGRVGMVLRLS